MELTSISQRVVTAGGSLRMLPATKQSLSQRTLTASGQLRGDAGKLTSILCESGTSIVITIYDNPLRAVGIILHTSTMNGGEFLSLDKICMNGAWLSYTGTATFTAQTEEF